MATFFAIFNRREQAGKQPIGQKVFTPGATLETGLSKPTEVITTGNIEDACVLKFENVTAGAPSVGQVQSAIQSLYPGLVTTKTVVVSEAQFKES
jgi:hypothetical protein